MRTFGLAKTNGTPQTQLSVAPLSLLFPLFEQPPALSDEEEPSWPERQQVTIMEDVMVWELLWPLSVRSEAGGTVTMP
jgi:hypothetical protein